jgi:Tol biopolymer transport system component
MRSTLAVLTVEHTTNDPEVPMRHRRKTMPAGLDLLASLKVILALAAIAAAALVPSAASAKVGGPNGRIVFSREDFNSGLTIVYTVNPDGSGLKRLLPAGIGAGQPHWSPDGSRIAVISTLDQPCCDVFPYSAVIVNPDTGATRTLPMPSQRVTTFCNIWAPDAKRLACDGENDNNADVNGIYTIRTSDGGGLTRVTNANGGDDIPIDYSPNGAWILYGHTGPFHGCDSDSALWIVRVDGTDNHQLTPNGFCDDDGSWSPDGSWIAFEHSGSLFKIRPDGTGLSKIPLKTSSLNRAGDVVWSPNGRKISFLLFTSTSTGTGREGIATANIDGTDVQWITDSPSFDHEADWGPHR